MKRVETGPLTINDDWTGLFIRGDNALMLYGPALNRVLENPESIYTFDRQILTGLKDLLMSCKQGNAAQKITGTVE